MGIFDIFDGILGGITGRNNADAAKYAADRQWEIADKIQRREEFGHRVWQDHYREAELRLKNEICQTPRVYLDPVVTSIKIGRRIDKAFERTALKIERGIDLSCARFTCGNDSMQTLSRAGIHVWAAGMSFRADEDRALARNQQRYEDKARTAAFGHKSYFDTRGAQLAMGVYAQSAAMSLRQQNNTSAAMGYFLQRGLSFAQQQGWFGSGETAAAASGNTAPSNLSGQGGAETAMDSTYVSLPAADSSYTTSATAVEPTPASEMGSYGNGANYPG